MIAAHVNVGVKGGIVIVNAYLNTQYQFEDENMAMVWRIVEYLHMLNYKGFDWILMGGLQHGAAHAQWQPVG